MTRSAADFGQLQKAALVAILAAAGLALLIYGRGFVVPIVLAVLLYGLITSAVMRLEGFGFPTWLATVCSIGVSIIVLFIIGLIFNNQAGALTEVWPQYVARFDEIATEVTALAGTDFTRYISESIAKLDLGAPAASVASSAGGFLGNVVLILVYTGFLLADRGTLTSKLVELVPNKTDNEQLTAIFNSVGMGIRRYLSIKTVTSSLTGVLCYVILKAYGVDLAELWGLLIFLLNFIPTIGSIIAVIIPAVVTLVQFDTVWPFVQVTGLLCVVQFTVGNVIEPKFMGRTLNLSPFVVIVSLTFWSTIWGIEGAFLSVPITASLVIICRNIPQVRWIAVLLSADGKPEASSEPASIHLAWPFGKSNGESDEVKALRQELEAMKAQKSKPTRKSGTTAPQKSRSGPRKSKA